MTLLELELETLLELELETLLELELVTVLELELVTLLELELETSSGWAMSQYWQPPYPGRIFRMFWDTRHRPWYGFPPFLGCSTWPDGAHSSQSSRTSSAS